LEDGGDNVCWVEWPPGAMEANHCEATMIEELIQTGEAEMERIQRLRGYL
jgi:hypothetical protein